MQLLQISTALALWVGSASAFFPYIMEGHTGASRHANTGNEIARAFTVGSPSGGLPRATLHKRQVKRRSNFSKRLNDFEIVRAQQPEGEHSAAVHQDGTDFSYFSEVHLGSDPGETVYMLLDTGSSSMWVMGTDCTTSACMTHSRFGAEDSQSLEPSTESFEIGYNTGDVMGYVVTDTVSIAGLTFDMRFGIANTTSDHFNDYPMDGILGLARSSEGSGLQQPPFIARLVEEGLIESNMFGVNLNRASDGEADGAIIFGGVDDTKFEGEINYIPTTGNAREWRIPVDGLEWNGQALDIPDRVAIIDTGTTYSFIGPEDAATLWDNVEGSVLNPNTGVYRVPCDTDVPLAIRFGGVSYNISPEDYIGDTADDGLCYTTLIAQDASGEGGSWLLGGTFLKNVYAVFNVDDGSIGFAPQSSAGASSGDTPSSAAPSSTPSSTSGAAGESSSSTDGATSTESGSPPESSAAPTGSDEEADGLVPRPSTAADQAATTTDGADPESTSDSAASALKVSVVGLGLAMAAAVVL